MKLEQISIMRMDQEGKILTDILTLVSRTVTKLKMMKKLLKMEMVLLVGTLLMLKANKFSKIKCSISSSQ